MNKRRRCHMIKDGRMAKLNEQLKRGRKINNERRKRNG